MKKLILVFVFGLIINSSIAQEVKSYHLNGQLESIGMEKNGERTGLWKFYDGKNGGYGEVKDKTKIGPLIMEGAYIDGQKTGEWKEYFNNGKLEFIKNYKSDKLTGTFTHYDEKGELICKIEDFDENNPNIYISEYKFTLFPGNIKVGKSSENKLLIEGLQDLLGSPFTNSEELIKVTKHKYKAELKNSDIIVFEFTPYNSELILNKNTEDTEVRFVFRKTIK
jgi:antitoxin component YwqK of YwqJK toxin-antitoxin module|tara:strand:+ start:548 stop:1216 length:669 start_codon:yes stop_codon:yes gene_type:complete